MPSSFHFWSLLWFSAATGLIFLVLKELGASGKTAFWASLLYAVHPVFAFTEAWIPARGDILLTVWALFSFLHFMRWKKHGKTTSLIFHFTGFALALLSKETAVMLIPLFWSYELLFYKPFKIRTITIVNAVIYILLFAVFWWMRSQSVYLQSQHNLSLSHFTANLPTLPETLYYFFYHFNAFNLFS